MRLGAPLGLTDARAPAPMPAQSKRPRHLTRTSAHERADCGHRPRLCGVAGRVGICREISGHDRLRHRCGARRGAGAGRGLDRRDVARRTQSGSTELYASRRRPQRRGCFYRLRADTDRRSEAARSSSVAQRLRNRRARAETRNHRLLRIDRLSRSNRRLLRTDTRAGFGSDTGNGFPARLFARAHQSWGQRAYAATHRQSCRRRRQGDGRNSCATLRRDRACGHSRRAVDQGRRSCEGAGEHAARFEYRADERTGADLRPARHPHGRRAEGGARRSGTSCRSRQGSSAGTASASIPTT